MRSLAFLTDPISALIVPDAQVVPPVEAVRGWPLDPADLHALATWGLPRVGEQNLVPDPRPGPYDRTYDGAVTYRLGTEWGSVLAVVAGSGRVVRFGGAQRPEPMLVNSTLRCFVEASWRYLWLYGQEAGRYDDGTDDVLDAFLARVRAIDPTVGDDPESSYWPSVVEHW